MAAPRKSIPKSKIRDEASSSLTVRANEKDIKILGLIAGDAKSSGTVLELHPYVALKYFRSTWQCFSDWTPSELKEFSKFLESLQNNTWGQVYSSGGKIPKHGLAYTKYEIKDVKSRAMKSSLEAVKSEISEDINFFELRVNQNKLRVHGFQSQSVFFLVALDRNHEAFPF